MRISFDVAGVPVEFRRDNFFGTTEVRTADRIIPLQTPADLSTHFSATLSRKWNATISGVDVVIEKTRPLFLPWLRPNTYRVFVDGQLLLERFGY